MNEKEMKTLNLREIEEILRDRMVLVGPDDARNPIDIAEFLGLIELTHIETVNAGFYDGVDQCTMITHGRVLRPTGHGQLVMQAVARIY